MKPCGKCGSTEVKQIASVARGYLGAAQGCATFQVNLSICANCNNWLDFDVPESQPITEHRAVRRTRK